MSPTCVQKDTTILKFDVDHSDKVWTRVHHSEKKHDVFQKKHNAQGPIQLSILSQFLSQTPIIKTY